MSYYYQLFEAYIDKGTCSFNIVGSSHAKSLRQLDAADRLKRKIHTGQTIVRATVKNVTNLYWMEQCK